MGLFLVFGLGLIVVFGLPVEGGCLDLFASLCVFG